MESVFQKIIKHSIYIFFLVNIVMTILIIKNYTFILGWIVGSCASIIGFILSFFMINKIGSEIKTKKQGFLFGFCKTMIVVMFHGFVTIGVIFINTFISGEKMFWSGVKAIINPINFYSYLSGIFLIPLGTIISMIPNFKKGK